MSLSRRKLLSTAAVGIPATAMAVVTAKVPPALGQAAEFVPAIAPAGEAVVLKHPFKWYYTFDEELYRGGYASKEECLREAKELGAAVVAECQGQDWIVKVNGDEVLEMLYGHNEELMGEDGEFIEPNKAQVQELGEVVTKAIQDWVERNKIDTTAWVFGCIRNAEHLVEEPDDDEEHDPVKLAALGLVGGANGTG